MANDQLRHALHNAGLTPDELAELVAVDIRSIRRWLSGGTPYPRHRAKLARALNTTETELWPELAVSVHAPDGPPPAAAGEPLVGYARTDTTNLPDPEQLIAATSQRIDLLDRTVHRLLIRPGLTDLLATVAAGGCQIRILIAEPGPSLTPLLDQDRIEIRALETDEPITIHRYDNQILATIRLTPGLTEPLPLLHLHHHTPDGLFDRLTTHYQQLWDAGEPIETETDIDTYLYDPEYDDPSLDDDWVNEATDGDHRPEPEPVEPHRPLPVETQPQHTNPRRWPRRPTT